MANSLFRGALRCSCALIAVIPAAAFAQAGSAPSQTTNVPPSDQNPVGTVTTQQTREQAEVDAVEEGQDESEIVVTGTQIRGVTPAGATLLATTAQQAEEQGATNGNEILSQIPQAANFFQSVPSLAGLGPTTGGLVAAARLPSQGVALRNLPNVNTGGAPTLTLIDGHRVVPSGTDVLGGQQVDNSIISATGTLRTEVMPDGASAIYGSDAVVGVINIVTRDSFDGVEVQGRVGVAGDYLQYDGSIAAGTRWATGSVFGTYSYSYHDPLFGRDRDYLATVDANQLSPLYNMVTGLNCTAPNIAITTASRRRLYPLTGPGGTIQGFTTNFGSSGNPQAGAAGTNGIAGGNRCNNGDFSSNYPEENRHNASFRLRA
jgi:iron complex outermembrane recepter protein